MDYVSVVNSVGKTTFHCFGDRGEAVNKELVAELRERYPQGVPLSKARSAMPDADFLSSYEAGQNIPVTIVAEELEKLRNAALKSE